MILRKNMLFGIFVMICMITPLNSVDALVSLFGGYFGKVYDPMESKKDAQPVLDENQMPHTSTNAAEPREFPLGNGIC